MRGWIHWAVIFAAIAIASSAQEKKKRSAREWNSMQKKDWQAMTESIGEEVTAHLDSHPCA